MKFEAKGKSVKVDTIVVVYPWARTDNQNPLFFLRNYSNQMIYQLTNYVFCLFSPKLSNKFVSRICLNFKVSQQWTTRSPVHGNSTIIPKMKNQELVSQTL